MRGPSEGMSNTACSCRLSWSNNLPPWNKCQKKAVFMRAKIRGRDWEWICFLAGNKHMEDDGENLRWLKVTHLPTSFSPSADESLSNTILVSRVTEHNKLTFKWPSEGCEEGGRWRGKQKTKREMTTTRRWKARQGKGSKEESGMR